MEGAVGVFCLSTPAGVITNMAARVAGEAGEAHELPSPTLFSARAGS